MTFSEQFKDVFELICDKIGIAIDWTQENIVPYVMELCKRFVILNVVEESLWLVIGIACIVVTGLVFKAIIKDYKTCYKTHKDTFWWEISCGSVWTKVGTIFALVIGSFVMIFGLIMVPCAISEILKWALIPEIQIVEEISKLLSAM